MCAFTEFYSHSSENGKPAQSLAVHLLDVASRTKEIISGTGFAGDADLGYYIGLLHDIGKINPYYQELFRLDSSSTAAKESLQKIYPRAHAPYSAWLAKKMLCNLSLQQKSEALVLIYKHHGRLSRSVGSYERNSPDIREHIKENLENFATYKDKGFDKLNWDIPDRFFKTAMRYDAVLEPHHDHDFLRIGFLFSALLQADRGSFDKFDETGFDVAVNTDKLASNNSSLSELRAKMQHSIMQNYDDTLPIQIIQAPTGAGKTKAFLDIVKKYGTNYSRVFYFSPLLALTDDFEGKIKQHNLLAPLEDVLSYNSIHAETLQDNAENETSWSFEYESFNKKFVITTMKRLLMTIYSPSHKDKLKLASFRDSMLIVDEVQTMPKALLADMMQQLQNLNKFLHTKILLISATIPHELKDIPRIQLPKNITTDYLAKTKKRISVVPDLDVTSINDKKFLIMLNTKRRAKSAWEQLDDKNITYITSGIKKREKKSRINAIDSHDAKIVSTQTIEAGVDKSLPMIYRQMAPLDSIVQMLGRLDRENKSPDTALLTVFEPDENYMPYDKIEYITSKEFLQSITDSVALYNILSKYYKAIHENNLANIEQSHTISYNTQKLDFENTWSIVQKLFDQHSDTIVIPDKKDWQKTKKLLEEKKYAKISDFTATLPVLPCAKTIRDYFDDDMMEKGILLPNENALDEIYDEHIGLDKWIA